MRSVPLFLGLFTCSALGLSGAPVPAQGHVLQRAVSFGPIVVTAASAAVPVFGRDFPDPSVIAFGGRYYAFGTQTAWETRGRVFPILVSSDLTSWSYGGDVFSAPPAWGRGDWWAPAVVRRGDTFYLYYSGYARSSSMHCIAVATARAPVGPYTDHGPIACEDGASAGYIDASPFVAADRAYLYFSVDGPDHHSISVLPLSADMLRVAGPRVELFGITQDWERTGAGTVEGPSVFAWGSRYVMLYSGGDWRGQYGMGYAVANSPLGPFVKSATPLLSNGGSLIGPGGGSFFLDSSGLPWLAFHGWSGAGRALYVSPLSMSRPV